MFKTYLHPETCLTTKPASEIEFVGYSYPHYADIRARLHEKHSGKHESLPVRFAQFKDFLEVHSQTYLNNLKKLEAGEKVEGQRLGMECTGLEFCLPGYLAGLGGMQEAIDQMASRQLSASYLFSLVGHHSYRHWGHGYCLLNPQAAAVRYAQKSGFDNILIIDWDIHHGDGTQAIFANDSTVHCLSIHSGLDLYMSMMKVIHDGSTVSGKKVGHSNIPLVHADYTDEDVKQLKYLGDFYRAGQSLDIFAQTLNSLNFSPDLITIFSGYDGHKKDCGDEITDWDNSSFHQLTIITMEYAQKRSCPILSVHGGGYKTEVTVSAASTHIETLASYTL